MDSGQLTTERVRVPTPQAYDLSRKDWAKRFNRYLEVVEALLWPDLVIIGGGVSKAPEKVMPLLESRADIVPATLANAAGSSAPR